MAPEIGPRWANIAPRWVLRACSFKKPCPQPIVINQMSPTSCHQLIVTNQLSSTNCHQPVVINQLPPTINCHTPIATNQLLPTNFETYVSVEARDSWIFFCEKMNNYEIENIEKMVVYVLMKNI